jgi:hypothetical protein
MSKNTNNKQLKISKIEITNDRISARGGLALFLHNNSQTTFLLKKDIMISKSNSTSLKGIEL